MKNKSTLEEPPDGSNENKTTESDCIGVLLNPTIKPLADDFSTRSEISASHIEAIIDLDEQREPPGFVLSILSSLTISLIYLTFTVGLPGKKIIVETTDELDDFLHDVKVELDILFRETSIPFFKKVLACYHAINDCFILRKISDNQKFYK